MKNWRNQRKQVKNEEKPRKTIEKMNEINEWQKKAQHDQTLAKTTKSNEQGFFSVQRLLAFARSFSTLDSMLHISELFD
jgi:hypothetical protein